MNESLQSARNIHQIIIVLCTIVLFFALSMEAERNKYDLAAEELETFDKAIEEVNADRVARIIRFAESDSLKDRVKFEKTIAYKHMPLSEIESLMRRSWEDLDSMWLPIPVKPNLEIPVRIAGIPVEVSVGNGWRTERDLYSGSNYRHMFKLKKLLIPTTEGDSFLIATRRVWPEVKNMTLPDAIYHLKTSDSSSKEKGNSDVEMSGLKVAGKQVYLIGPALIYALMLYLFTLTSHIRSITDGRDSLRNFPWMGVFRNWLPRGLTIITLLFYPIVVTVLIVCKTPIGQSALYYVNGYWVTGLILGVLNLYNLLKIQQQIGR